MSPSESTPQGLSHVVFFTLHDRSPAAARDLVADCQKYLSGQKGVVYFSAGNRTADLARPVNDTQFDVALHVVFATREDHDRYQTDPQHLEFVEKNKATWSQVRVFDASVA